jgi:hypothetical protein
MFDIDVSMGDNNLTQSLKDTYNYEKSIVPFVSMNKIKECPHLGGLATKAKNKVLV